MKRSQSSMALILAFLFILCGCSGQTPTVEKPTSPEPDNAAFKGSSYLLQMEDLKAISLAAKFLREIGENVDFQETYIEYHEADIEAHLSLANGESIQYTGEYLEIRLYYSTDPVNNPCASFIVVYVNGDGKVLGHNKISNAGPAAAAAIADLVNLVYQL